MTKRQLLLMPTALITGCASQDDSYLTEFLLDKGYEVHSLIRRALILLCLPFRALIAIL